jgi:hypothetical protein
MIHPRHCDGRSHEDFSFSSATGMGCLAALAKTVNIRR